VHRDANGCSCGRDMVIDRARLRMSALSGLDRHVQSPRTVCGVGQNTEFLDTEALRGIRLRGQRIGRLPLAVRNSASRALEKLFSTRFFHHDPEAFFHHSPEAEVYVRAPLGQRRSLSLSLSG
jgi:hypothetical protein